MRPIITSGWLFALVVLFGVVEGTRVGTAQTPRATTLTGLEVIEVQPNLHMIAGAGGNIAVQTGADGIVIVDAGSAAMTDSVLAELKKLTDKPLRYIINTSADV